MTSYDYDDTPIKHVHDKSIGERIDKQIRDIKYIDPYNMDDLEFEEEIENFERIRTKNKKKKGSQ